MKTTNFFIDFIVVGFIGIAALCLPVAMLGNGFRVTLVHHADTIIKLTPILTVATYAYGVLFNQVSDRVDDLLSACVSWDWLLVVDRARTGVREKTGRTDHDCVQYIVLHSPAAYEYLSFRRSVLRIIRALLTMCLIVLVSHPLSSLVLTLGGHRLSWSGTNASVTAVLAMLTVFMVYTLRKLGIGYFSSIESFYFSLQEDKHRQEGKSSQ